MKKRNIIKMNLYRIIRYIVIKLDYRSKNLKIKNLDSRIFRLCSKKIFQIILKA